MLSESGILVALDEKALSEWENNLSADIYQRCHFSDNLNHLCSCLLLPILTTHGNMVVSTHSLTARNRRQTRSQSVSTSSISVIAQHYTPRTMRGSAFCTLILRVSEQALMWVPRALGADMETSIMIIIHLLSHNYHTLSQLYSPAGHYRLEQSTAAHKV